MKLVHIPIYDPNIACGDLNNDGKEEKVLITKLRIALFSHRGDKIWEKFIRPKAAKKKRRKEEDEYNVTFDTYTSADLPILVKLVDSDGDGLKEILIARADNVVFLVNEKGKEIWSAEIPVDIKHISVGDIDGDGREEFVITTWNGSLFISEYRFGRIKLREKFANEYIDFAEVCDVDSDGSFELVFIQKGDGLKIIKGDRCIKKIGYPNVHVNHLTYGDINGDDVTEIIVGDETGYIRVIYPKDNQVEDLVQAKQEIIGLFTYDIDSDVTPELIIGYDLMAKILDWRNGKLIEIKRKNEWKKIITDIDGDGINEHILTYDKELLVTKKEQIIWSKKFNEWISTISLSDLNNDRYLEFLIGTSGRDIYVCDSHGNLLLSKKLTTVPLISIIDDFDNDGLKEILLMGKKSLHLLKLL